MLIAPADSPKTVTLPGSPPKAAMFSCTHSQRRELVEQAKVGDAVAEIEEPLRAGTPVDDHTDDAVPGEAAAVVGRRRAELEHTALDPDHHRQPRRAGLRRPDVEVQAVLGRRGPLHRRECGRDLFPVLGCPLGAAGGRRLNLRGLRPQPGGLTNTGPGRDRPGRPEPVGAEGRRGKRYPEEGVDPGGSAAAKFAVDRPDQVVHHTIVRAAHRPGKGPWSCAGAGTQDAKKNSPAASAAGLFFASRGPSDGQPISGLTQISKYYLRILVTRPEPTVRPPSRIAKPRPSSMAMGWMSATVISVLSPGITISVPSGRVITPVTSVVRK